MTEEQTEALYTSAAYLKLIADALEDDLELPSTAKGLRAVADKLLVLAKEDDSDG